jgi:hypothetical protein
LLICKKLEPFYTYLTPHAALLLSLILAQLSYCLIEKPIKNRLLPSPKKTLLYMLLISVIAAFAIALMHQSAKSKYESSNQQKILSVKNFSPSLYQYKNCDTWYHSDKLHPCTFGNHRMQKTVVLIGDSIAAQWFTPLLEYAQEKGVKLIVLNKSSCPIVNLSYHLQEIRQEYSVCTEWRNKAIQYINHLQPGMVIISHANDYPFTEMQWFLGSQDIFNAINPSIAIKVILGTPKHNIDPVLCLSRADHISKFFGDITFKQCDSKLTIPEQIDGQKEAILAFSHVEMIDMNELICPKHRCSAVLNGVTTYRDDKHLSVEFSRSLKTELVNRLFSE